MADLCPLALAMIAVSEDNRRLRAEVAARDRALDGCADRAADRAVRAYEHGIAAGRVELELRTAERQVLTLTEQLAEVTNELATVQADRAAADRNAATYRRDLLALQDRVVELEGRLAEAQDDARADRDALQRYRAWRPKLELMATRINVMADLYGSVSALSIAREIRALLAADEVTP